MVYVSTDSDSEAAIYPTFPLKCKNCFHPTTTQTFSFNNNIKRKGGRKKQSLFQGLVLSLTLN